MSFNHVNESCTLDYHIYIYIIKMAEAKTSNAEAKTSKAEEKTLNAGVKTKHTITL